MKFARASRVIAAPPGRWLPVREDGKPAYRVGERKVRTPQGSVLANGEG